jgi:hypothetical protein
MFAVGSEEVLDKNYFVLAKKEVDTDFLKRKFLAGAIILQNSWK